MTGVSLIWMRRDLRLDDHSSLQIALKADEKIQPVFIFDTDILQHFPDKKDKRLSFLAQRLCVLDEQMKARGGRLLVLHGSAQKLIPQLAEICAAKQVVAAEDFEPSARTRDAQVKQDLPSACRFVQPLDHLIHAPHAVLKGDDTPYKVFTPYAKRWRALLEDYHFSERKVKDKGRYADYDYIVSCCVSAELTVLNCSDGAEKMLSTIGYEGTDLGEWTVDEKSIEARLKLFISERLSGYKNARDLMAEEGTSKLSPYLRFGCVSIRHCARLASHHQNIGSETWMNELIWRDFYAMILAHFPAVVEHEFQEKYRAGVLEWSHNSEYIKAFEEGKTGYPVVDAAMRQLNETGWMHNRARMIVASFATKHLGLDWRIGERYFAQKLMDYDLASNNGGWQWAASTGTDAQPYFRVFNPTTQGERFDPVGEYVKRFVPELRDVDRKHIHEPSKLGLLKPADYPEPIVEHKAAREAAIARFKRG